MDNVLIEKIKILKDEMQIECTALTECEKKFIDSMDKFVQVKCDLSERQIKWIEDIFDRMKFKTPKV